jgi:hypothetical protein
VHSINQNRLHVSIRHVPPTEYEPEHYRQLHRPVATAAAGRTRPPLDRHRDGSG